MEVLSHEKPENEVLYTVSQVAKIYKTSTRVIRNLIRSGALKGIRLGDMKVTHTEMMDFLSRNTGMDLSNPYNIKPINNETSNDNDRSDDYGKNTTS